MADLTQENIEKQLEDAIDNIDDQNQSSIIFHDWSTETVNVNTLLKRYKEGKFILPLCQRLYVWDEKKRQSLFESIKRNLPCGTIILAEIEGTKYLVDGLQRTTSLMLLTNDKKLTEEDKKMVRNYKISVVTVVDMDLESMKNYFAVLNSGVALAATVRERSKLSENLNTAVLSVANSANQFFRKAETTATFNKSHHHELIAMNSLLAVSSIEFTENKARALCNLLSENEEVILQHTEQAQELINRLASIYEGIDAAISKRSLNANFVGILVHVLVDKPEFIDVQIRALINYIFAGNRAVKEYSVTTSQGGGDAKKCADRYEVLVRLLENPPTLEFDEAAFKRFLKEHKDTDVYDSTGKFVVAYSALTDDDLRALYLANRESKQSVYDKIIENRHKEVIG